MTIDNIKKYIEVLFSKNTFNQKLNYLKFQMDGKNSLLLNYDPVTMSVVVTGRCNFFCNMCPTHSKLIPDDYPYSQKTKRDMDFNLFKKIIDRFDKAINVQLIGSGEPLLNKELFKIIEYAANIKKMRVKVVSNGGLVEENADKIVNSKLDGITISLNGHNPNEFKRITGMSKEWYPKIYKGVKSLVKKKMESNAKVLVKLSFIVDRKNYNYIPEMIKVSGELEVDHTFFCNFLPNPYDGFRAEDRTLMADDKMAIDTIRNAIDNLPHKVKKKVTFPTLLDLNGQEKKCRVHFSQLRVDGDGNVSSCSMMLLNMNGQGHFLDNDVWNNNFFQEMRKKFLENGNNSLLDPCKVCIDNYGARLWN